jgi:hypothetical protein
MVISSRTPEGRQNHCEICNHAFVLEPSCVGHDATCPCCGSLAWFDRRAPLAYEAGVHPLEAQFDLPRRFKLRRTPALPIALLCGCWMAARQLWSVLNKPLPTLRGLLAGKA